MVLALPAFGLPSLISLPAPATPTTAHEHERMVQVPVPRARWALSAVLLTAAFAGLAGSTMSRYDLLLGPMGQTRLVQFGNSAPRVAGWAGVRDERSPKIAWTLGSDVTWQRYRYRPLMDRSPADPDGIPVTVDVLSFPRPGGLSRYGVDVPYGVYGRLFDRHVVDLGAGLTGELTSYARGNGPIEWVAVSWDWPVQAFGSRRYEHVVVSLAAPGATGVMSPIVYPGGWPERVQLVVADWLDAGRTAPLDSSVLAGRDLLVGFAMEMVRSAVTEAQSGAGAGR
jgi:hypothetical protein